MSILKLNQEFKDLESNAKQSGINSKLNNLPRICNLDERYIDYYYLEEGHISNYYQTLWFQGYDSVNIEPAVFELWNKQITTTNITNAHEDDWVRRIEQSFEQNKEIQLNIESEYIGKNSTEEEISDLINFVEKIDNDTKN